MSAGTLDALHPDIREYAQQLIDSGQFTVYAPTERRIGTDAAQLEFFHYSRTVDGRPCFGTYSLGNSSNFGAPRHTMPIKPSRLNGSSATIGARWGDGATLNLDNLEPDTIAYAEAVARPANWCPYNAEPTPEATRRANGPNGAPQRFYRGATLRNAEPWGIGSHYLPVNPATGAEQTTRRCRTCGGSSIDSDTHALAGGTWPAPVAHDTHCPGATSPAAHEYEVTRL